MNVMSIEFCNKTKYKFNKSVFRTVIKRAQELLSLSVEELSIVFLEKKEMQKINFVYRKKNAPTDVLSFDYGEIVLCPSYIIEKYGLSPAVVHDKIVELFVHGVAHIAGFSHITKIKGKQMRIVENRILYSKFQNAKFKIAI